MNKVIEAPRRGALGGAQRKLNQSETLCTRNAMKQAYVDWAVELKPTALLTLTVNGSDQRDIISDDIFLKSVKKLLHYVNYDLFGREYKKKGLGLQGIGCIEKQANGQPHVHIAIKNTMSTDQFDRLKNVLYNKIRKFKLFANAGTDLRPIRSSNEDFRKVGSYLAKEMRMLTLGPDGLY